MNRFPSRRALVVLSVAVVALAGVSSNASAEPYARAGWTAELETYAHDVSGVAIIVDADTFRVDDFTYDGGGPAVYFYLGRDTSNEAFKQGLRVGPLLTGTTFDHDSLVIDLDGTTLDGYHALSVWCEDFYVDFGSATFTPGPLDTNLDQIVNSADIDAIYHDPAFGGAGTGPVDYNNDSAVNQIDVDDWLSDFGTVRGDANLDADVDVWALDGTGDAQVLSSNLGTTTGAIWGNGDFNGDGDVDVWAFDGSGDAQILSENLNTSAGDMGVRTTVVLTATSVPEPSTTAMLIVAGVIGIVCRRRKPWGD